MKRITVFLATAVLLIGSFQLLRAEEYLDPDEILIWMVQPGTQRYFDSKLGPCGDFLILSGNAVETRNTETGELIIPPVPLGEYHVQKIALSPDSNLVIYTINNDNGESYLTVRETQTLTEVKRFSYNNRRLGSYVAFSPDGKTIAAGGWGDNSYDYPHLIFWDFESGEVKKVFLRSNSPINYGMGERNMEYTKDGNYFIVCFDDLDKDWLGNFYYAPNVYVFDANTHELLRTLPMHGRFALSPDGEEIAITNADSLNLIDIFDLETWELLQQIPGKINSSQSMVEIEYAHTLPIIYYSIDNGGQYYWNYETQSGIKFYNDVSFFYTESFSIDDSYMYAALGSTIVKLDNNKIVSSVAGVSEATESKFDLLSYNGSNMELMYSGSPENRATISIYDLNANKIAETYFESLNEGNLISFNLSSVSDGIYFIRLTTDTFEFSQKIMLVK